MATVKFFADDFGVTNLNNSGLGFYGDGFGTSVNVGEYQETTFITNSNGTAQGPQVNNIMYINSMSGEVNGAGSGILLTSIPNYLATLNIRFEHGSAVRVQNCRWYIYDRTSINNPASGVTTKVAELIHPDIVQNNNGSGDTTWTTYDGTSSGSYLSLAVSPGASGLYAGNGANSTRSDTRHDLYLAISASPDSIGSKNLYAGYFSCEYL